MGGYNLGFANNNCVTTRNQDVFWVGAKYSMTPALDIAASYYGVRQRFFTQGAGGCDRASTFFSNAPGGPLNPGSLAAQQAACAAHPEGKVKEI